jgi:hypothetical protein
MQPARREAGRGRERGVCLIKNINYNFSYYI